VVGATIRVKQQERQNMPKEEKGATDSAYDGLSNGDDLAGVYIQHALPVVQQQLLNAGIRLAKIIDENF
jgi:hypothetical protein